MAMDEHDMQQESILWPWSDDPAPDTTDEDNYDPDADTDTDDTDDDDVVIDGCFRVDGRGRLCIRKKMIRDAGLNGQSVAVWADKDDNDVPIIKIGYNAQAGAGSVRRYFVDSRDRNVRISRRTLEQISKPIAKAYKVEIFAHPSGSQMIVVSAP